MSKPGREPRPTVAVDARALLTAPHGIATYTEALLEELARLERYDLVAVAHRPLPQLPPGVTSAIQPASKGVLWQQLRLPWWLRRRRPELLWSPLQTLPLLASALAPHTALVTTVHDLTVLTHPAAHTRKVKWSQLPLLGKSLQRAHRVVAISQATAAEIRRHFPRVPADRVRVISNGIGSDFTPLSQDEIVAQRRRLGAPEGYVLAVGTLEPRKNLGYLLDAWEPMRRRGEAPPLLLAGPEGWGEQTLRERLVALEGLGVRRMGVLDRADLVATMGAASVFVYPSLAEGFGLPPAEAMACGVPTIACNISSLPEVVGDAGLLVDPSNPAALEAALHEVLTNPAMAADLGHRGRHRARTFTWPRAAKALAVAFDEAMEATGAKKG